MIYHKGQIKYLICYMEAVGGLISGHSVSYMYNPDTTITSIVYIGCWG